MRLLLARDTRYDADFRCRIVVDAKRVLAEHAVSTLLLAGDCAGRESSLTIIDWAYKKRRLPKHITLIEPDPRLCRVIGDMLTTRGYRALDMRNFVSRA